MTKRILILLMMCMARLGLAAITIIPGNPGDPTALISPTFYAMTNSVFTYYGLPVTNYQHPNASFLQYRYQTNNGISSTNEMPPLIVSFSFTGSNFEWKCLNDGYGVCEVSAGGTNRSGSFLALYPNSSPTLYKVDMPSYGTWNIKLYLQGAFAGVNIQSGDTIGTNTLPRQRVLIVIGDSYTEGYCPDDSTYWIGGFAWQTGYKTTNMDVIPSGISGTGYENAYQDGTKYQGRVMADVIRFATNDYYKGTNVFILVTGTINDNGYATNTIYQDATNLFSALNTYAPLAHKAVIGPWYKDSVPNSDDIGRDIVIGAAATNYGFKFVSPQVNLWGRGGVGSDSVHPTLARYAEWASYINTNMNNWFAWWPGTNASTSTLNVTNYGARGDAVSFAASTVSNSPVVTVLGTNRFTTADVGKVIEVFRAGSNITYQASLVVTQQDIVALITAVTNGTNLTISIAPGKTMASALAIVGTNNAAAFQAAVDAATTNATILVPAGNYLLLSSQALNPSYVMGSISDGHPAVTISTGGIHFLGESATNTTLLGCGAGMNHLVDTNNMFPFGNPPYVPYRGFLFWCSGPVTNSQYPLVFENLTFDGGLTNGLQSYNYFTVIQGNGDGWDTTHGAVLDWAAGDVQMHQEKAFINCNFQHWRGEILKSTVASGGTNTFIDITNCVFTDGNASAFNFTFGHHIQHSTFSNLVKVLELYQDYTRLPSVFEFNTWTNMGWAGAGGNPFTIVGSTTNRNPPSYTIRGNNLSSAAGNQISFSPAENIVVSSNIFHGQSSGVVFSGAGLQPADGSASVISNVTITYNSFNDTYTPITMDDYAVVNVSVTYNTSASPYRFAIASGYKDNITFNHNTCGVFLDGTSISGGHYFLDDVANSFTAYYGDIDGVGTTKPIDYALGRLHAIGTTFTNTVYYANDSSASLIPAGAVMVITNAGAVATPLYLSTSLSGTPRIMGSADVVTAYWLNNAWSLTPIVWGMTITNP